MRKYTLFLIIMIAGLGFSIQATAHAVWIQCETKAEKNKVHEVKIFYGEYAAGEVDSTKKWYSDLKEMEVWMVSPNKQRTKLILKDASTHMTASFIPEEDGVYTLSVVHGTKDLGGSTKYEFSSVAYVASGNFKTGAIANPSAGLVIVAEPKLYPFNKTVELKVWKNGVVFSNAEVLIMSSEGWEKKFKTNNQGIVSFTPLWKGRYVIETSDSGKEAGEWHGKPYTSIWKGSTTSIVVN